MTERSDNRIDHEFDIAIIGLAARFPKSNSAEEFWKNLCAGIECINFFSNEELSRAGASAETLSRSTVVGAAALLDDIDLFDAEFFGYSPGEARIIDPQQRVFLESAWEALEDAGYVASKYSGLIGVYAGTGSNSYLMRLLSFGSLPSSTDGLQITLGNDKDYLTTRVSYKLNLRGPSVCVQTACSTSLAAVHMACQALIEHECDMALAGGVSIRCPQPMLYHYQPGGILSSDGHCRTFDSKASGTIFGNGLGIVVLKRYQDALDDGDHIYALIRGSAMNNDGSLKVGYTAPSVEGQAQVISRALAAGGIDPGSISYIETHGTGTPLGDPIEITALKQVVGYGKTSGSCALGAVKTNVGHLDTAAGVAGLIKTALALKHRIIPPTLHFDEPNPDLNLQDSPFKVQTQLTPWPSDQRPARAGVSSFGIGGTNVHVVLEEPPERPQHGPRREWQLMTLSARDEIALDQMTERLAAHLKSRPEVNLADVAYTTQVGREAFPFRCAFVARTVHEAIDVLERGRVSSLQPCDASMKPAIVFMFPGQGVQEVGMAREIYQTEPVFRDCVDHCADLLRHHLRRDIREVFYPAAAHAEAAANELEQTAWTQPALFVVEYALARLWMEWGIHPAAMIGHSLGELVAACLAGVFSIEDALAIVAQRGRLMQEMPRGSMLAVALPEAALHSLPAPVSVAAVNAPSLTVLSGPTGVIRDLQSQFERRKITCRLLRTSHAYHSMLMDAAMAPFRKAVQQARFDAPKLPYISCVTGQWINAEQATNPDYWAEQIRNPVRFSDGLNTVGSLPNSLLLEVGPGRALCKIARQHNLREARCAPLASLGGREEGCADGENLLSSLGELWSRGVEVRWDTFHSGDRRLRAPLPAYPFQRQRFWYNDGPAVSAEERLRLAQFQGGAKPSVPSVYFRPGWKLSSPVRLAPDAEILRSADGAWLIFEDNCGLAAALADGLRDKKQRVITARFGEKFARKAEDSFELDQSLREDYAHLLETLRSEGVFPHSIVDCAIASGRYRPSALASDTDAQLLKSFESLMLLTSEVGKLCDSPLRLFVVCDQLHSISGDELINPIESTVLGICRSAPLEIADLTCRCIDLVFPQDSSELHSQTKLLIDEMYHESPSPVVAYRGSNRWEQFFDSLSLPPVSSRNTVLRKHGVYLITGGFGGLGSEIALLLAQRYQARIALVGRTGLPERTDWSRWVQEHGDNDPISMKLAKIQAMERAGAEVLVLTADVTSRQQMEAAIGNIRQAFGEIHGVLHLAAIPGGGLIQTKTLEAASQVLAPKVQGTIILEEVLSDQKPDFVMLFSSTNAITGAIGQADYSAANAFLGAYAHSRQRNIATPTIAVDWDGWTLDSWQQKLYSAMPEVYRKLREHRERFGIGIEEGFEMLEQALLAALPQVIVSKQDIPAVVSRMQTGSQLASEGRQARRGGAIPHRRNGTHFVGPRNGTEEVVARIWQDVLGVSEVSVNDNFFQLGGHSLFAIQIAAQIREKFQVELEMRKMLERPTVAELAGLIETARIQNESELGEIMTVLNEITKLTPHEVREQLAIASSEDSSGTR